jgi:hypothetical protein
MGGLLPNGHRRRHQAGRGWGYEVEPGLGAGRAAQAGEAVTLLAEDFGQADEASESAVAAMGDAAGRGLGRGALVQTAADGGEGADEVPPRAEADDDMFGGCFHPCASLIEP